MVAYEQMALAGTSSFALHTCFLPVLPPFRGVTMSSSGPPEACTSGIKPALWEFHAVNTIQQAYWRSAYHELDNVDAEMLVDHCAQTD